MAHDTFNKTNENSVQRITWIMDGSLTPNNLNLEESRIK